MAIAKQFLKTKPECKVKFMLSAGDVSNADKVSLLGDFNRWDPAATPMKKQKNGGFSVSLNLPVGSTNKFRYLVNDSQWINDPVADGYEYCPFAGVNNSVLRL